MVQRTCSAAQQVALTLVTVTLAHDPGLGAQLALLSSYLTGSCLLRGLSGRPNALGFGNGSLPSPPGSVGRPSTTNCLHNLLPHCSEASAPGSPDFQGPSLQLWEGGFAFFWSVPCCWLEEVPVWLCEKRLVDFLSGCSSCWDLAGILLGRYSAQISL